MKIAIGCSMKYRDLVSETVAKLSELGMTPLFPNLDYSHENADKADAPEEKKRLAIEHYKAIDSADIVYLITPSGYMGTSCKLELGYAIARQKPIYFSEPTKDPALDCYVTGFIGINSLTEFSRIGT
jgi:nucleoside 2-deoxyribosyltransferase